MVTTKDAIDMARSLLGVPYGSGAGELDCINLIKKIIRTCPGGVPGYTTAGTNALWASRDASGKYRDITAWRELGSGESGRAGEILAMISGEHCDHVGLAIGDGTVIHASKSRGAVVCTDVVARETSTASSDAGIENSPERTRDAANAVGRATGWTHALTHRYIEVGGAEDELGTDEYVLGPHIVCAQGGLRQRETPGGRYMQMIPDGARVEITQAREGWGQTVWRGHAGWVSMDYLCYADGND